MILTTIKDTKLNVYTPPMPFNTKEEAIRTIKSNIAQFPYSNLAINASEYELWTCAEFNNEKGTIEQYDELVISKKEFQNIVNEMHNKSRKSIYQVNQVEGVLDYDFNNN